MGSDQAVLRVIGGSNQAVLRVIRGSDQAVLRDYLCDVRHFSVSARFRFLFMLLCVNRVSLLGSLLCL